MCDKKIAVASIPRSGTKYLFWAIDGSYKNVKRTHDSYRMKKPFDLPVICTHSKSEDVLQEGYKFIFLFRDPVQCIISTKNRIYDHKHFEHCGAEYPSKIDIYDKDILKYEEKFDSWNRDNGYPVILMRYSTIPKYYKLIEKFVGRKINFPKWKASKGVSEIPENVERIKKTYSKFIEKIKNMPEIKIFNWEDCCL